MNAAARARPRGPLNRLVTSKRARSFFSPRKGQASERRASPRGRKEKSPRKKPEGRERDIISGLAGTTCALGWAEGECVIVLFRVQRGCRSATAAEVCVNSMIVLFIRLAAHV